MVKGLDGGLEEFLYFESLGRGLSGWRRLITFAAHGVPVSAFEALDDEVVMGWTSCHERLLRDPIPCG